MPVTQLITTLPYTPEVLYTLPQSLGILNSYSPSESCNAAKKKKLHVHCERKNIIILNNSVVMNEHFYHKK